MFEISACCFKPGIKTIVCFKAIRGIGFISKRKESLLLKLKQFERRDCYDQTEVCFMEQR